MYFEYYTEDLIEEEISDLDKIRKYIRSTYNQ